MALLKLERLTIKAAKRMGFDYVDMEHRGSGHKLINLEYNGKPCSIMVPSSPANYDEAGKLARRKLVKIKREMK